VKRKNPTPEKGIRKMRKKKKKKKKNSIRKFLDNQVN
jgi:hypothetical protein